ncbi:DNA polymerase, partial [Salmonella enterica subsp. enterica serovar Kentucky]|nr:DNA polymerase [Salmonella enterica subsp. enterica serovar Kentucky]
RNGVNDNGAILPSVTGIRWPTSAFLFFIFFQADKVTQNVNGYPSTSEEVLEELALDYPLPKVILEYRGLAKLKSTYTDKLPLMI